jgi:hypothetical protein
MQRARRCRNALFIAAGAGLALVWQPAALAATSKPLTGHEARMREREVLALAHRYIDQRVGYQGIPAQWLQSDVFANGNRSADAIGNNVAFWKEVQSVTLELDQFSRLAFRDWADRCSIAVSPDTYQVFERTTLSNFNRAAVNLQKLLSDAELHQVIDHAPQQLNLVQVVYVTSLSDAFIDSIGRLHRAKDLGSPAWACTDFYKDEVSKLAGTYKSETFTFVRNGQTPRDPDFDELRKAIDGMDGGLRTVLVADFPNYEASRLAAIQAEESRWRWPWEDD